MDIEKAKHLLADFFSSGEELKFRRREAIIQIHDSSKHVYLVRRGIVRAYSYSDTGDAVVHYLDKESEIFPLSQLYGNVDCEIGFSAFSDVVAQRRLFSDFIQFLSKEPYAMTAIIKQQATIYERLLTINTNPANKRLSKWLMTMSDRFGEKKSDHVEIDLSATVQELADCVRLSRESAGKILKTLETEGAIIVGRRRIIVYPEKLEPYLQ